jgi:hypothetical protein
MSVNYADGRLRYVSSHMAIEELSALEGLLARMRTLYAEMSAHHGGVALLHLEAAIASLESHLRNQRLAA